MKEITPVRYQDLDYQEDEGLRIVLYLSYNFYLAAMADRTQGNYREDEYDVDFKDASKFAAVRFVDIVTTIDEDLLESDSRAIREQRDWQSVYVEITRKRDDKNIAGTTRRLVNQFLEVPRTLNQLAAEFEKSIQPEVVPLQVLWGLLFLNIKLSYESTKKLKYTTAWLARLRRELELFNRCLDACAESEANEANEARIAMIDVFDPLLAALARSVKYLRSSPTDKDLEENSPDFDTLISDYLNSIKSTVTHLNEITKFSSVNRGRLQKTLQDRHTLDAEPLEAGVFPMDMLPHRENENFYGREEELNKINEALRPRPDEAPRLRTYTIYGRRGVGKTDLAIKYCYKSLFARTFDAIFWVQCETALALRQSFTDMAIKLDLPRADKHGHHEENQLAVLKWLKKTKKNWLLIFDNAEKESLLKGYFPKGVDGSILITSRKYYNFMRDDDRKGDTIKLFTPEQSFDLLCNLLGGAWKSLKDEKKMPESEVVAAKKLLDRLTGLALAIQQASVLIKNEKIGGNTIESTFQLFEEHSATLPDRQLGKRSDTYHALEALWDMNFGMLDDNSWQLLAVLSLLSPDTTYIELFLPRRQTALANKLAFCRQLPGHVDAESQATLTNVVEPTPALEAAISTLLKAGLIRLVGRILSVHREVQEAMNFHSALELQEYFDAAVKIVHEAFPKRKHGIALFEQWSICSQYIHDGVHLAWKFRDYNAEPTNPRLEGSKEFVELVGNCVWYLYEVGDYDGALEVIEIGYSACRRDMRESLLYADLCNTAGACWYEKNDLPKGLPAYETSFRIRSKLLDKDDIDIGAVIHNIANLESAAGNFDRATELFNRAIEIRGRQGPLAANQLALLYLCIGRNHFWQRQYDEAESSYRKAETLFARTIGADKSYMAHVHYAYGNLEYGLEKYLQARRSYNECLKIAAAETPIHPITAAAWYSLGCVEYRLKNYDVARSHLDKARSIAELRSPNRDDGTITRIIWMTSQVLHEDILAVAQENALKARAEEARRDLTDQGESTPAQAYDEEGNLVEPDEETLYDNLVPGFFR